MTTSCTIPFLTTSSNTRQHGGNTSFMDKLRRQRSLTLSNTNNNNNDATSSQNSHQPHLNNIEDVMKSSSRFDFEGPLFQRQLSDLISFPDFRNQQQNYNTTNNNNNSNNIPLSRTISLDSLKLDEHLLPVQQQQHVNAQPPRPLMQRAPSEISITPELLREAFATRAFSFIGMSSDYLSKFMHSFDEQQLQSQQQFPIQYHYTSNNNVNVQQQSSPTVVNIPAPQFASMSGSANQSSNEDVSVDYNINDEDFLPTVGKLSGSKRKKGKEVKMICIIDDDGNERMVPKPKRKYRKRTKAEREEDGVAKVRKRRRNEWTSEEVVLLLHCTKMLIGYELKTISQALFDLVKRDPGKCWGRAAEKKLKRMKIFENWKTCDKDEVAVKIDDELAKHEALPEERLTELKAVAAKVKSDADKLAAEQSSRV